MLFGCWGTTQGTRSTLRDRHNRYTDTHTQTDIQRCTQAHTTGAQADTQRSHRHMHRGAQTHTDSPRHMHGRCTQRQTRTQWTHRHTQTPARTPRDGHINTPMHTHAHIPRCFQPTPQGGPRHLQSCSSSVHRWKVMRGLGRGTLSGRSWRGSPEGRSRLRRPRRRGLWESFLPLPRPQLPSGGPEEMAEPRYLPRLALLSSPASLPPSAHWS